MSPRGEPSLLACCLGMTCTPSLLCIRQVLSWLSYKAIKNPNNLLMSAGVYIFTSFYISIPYPAFLYLYHSICGQSPLGLQKLRYFSFSSFMKSLAVYFISGYKDTTIFLHSNELFSFSFILLKRCRTWTESFAFKGQRVIHLHHTSIGTAEGIRIPALLDENQTCSTNYTTAAYYLGCKDGTAPSSARSQLATSL